MPEMTLVLIVSAMIMQTGIELATSYTKRQVTQRTAATLSRVADDVESYMSRNYFDLLARTGAARGSTYEADWDALIAANRISLDTPPVSPDGGEVRLFFTRNFDTVYAVIMSYDGIETRHSPRPDPNTSMAGKVQPHRPNTLVGWDFELNLDEIQAMTGESMVGNIGVIRHVARDVNVDPYLHRIVVPGEPELNEMQADLDMGGFSLTNALNVTTQEMTVQDQMTVDGRLRAAQIVSTGDAQVEEMNAQRLTSREITATNATVDNRVSTNNAVAQGLTTVTLQGVSASFGNLTAEELEGGSIFLTSGNYVQIDVNRVDAEQVIADDVFIGD